MVAVVISLTIGSFHFSVNVPAIFNLALFVFEVLCRFRKKDLIINFEPL